MAGSWEAFMRRVADPKQPWLRVVRSHGEACVESVYAALLAGDVGADEGHVLSVGSLPADRHNIQGGASAPDII
jgi:hypothetical protein